MARIDTRFSSSRRATPPGLPPGGTPYSGGVKTTQYTQSPAPVADPFNEQRYAGMYAAAQKADPYAQQRSGYLNQLQQMMQGGAAAFTPTDPSYAFRFGQGQQALESSLAAKGLLGAGRAGIELQEYGQQAASQEFQSQFDRLQQLAGMGDPAAAARLEQEAVEGRYRTYQPTMIPVAETSTEYGYGGGAGGGVGSGRAGSRSGASRTTGSAVADLLARVPTQYTKTRQFEKDLMAARAQDAASGFEALPGFGGRGGGGGADLSTYERNLAPSQQQRSIPRTPYNPMGGIQRMAALGSMVRGKR